MYEFGLLQTLEAESCVLEIEKGDAGLVGMGEFNVQETQLIFLGSADATLETTGVEIVFWAVDERYEGRGPVVLRIVELREVFWWECSERWTAIQVQIGDESERSCDG